MRWKEKSRNYDGDKMTREFFAILPITLDKETRWLERVRVEYVCSKFYNYDWLPLRFVDKN